MKKPYKRKTEKWAKELASDFASGRIDWFTFLSNLQEDLWRLSHNYTNKRLYITELANRLEGAKLLK